MPPIGRAPNWKSLSKKATKTYRSHIFVGVGANGAEAKVNALALATAAEDAVGRAVGHTVRLTDNELLKNAGHDFPATDYPATDYPATDYTDEPHTFVALYGIYTKTAR